FVKLANDRYGDEGRHHDGEQRVERRSEAVSEKFLEQSLSQFLGCLRIGRPIPRKNRPMPAANAIAAGHRKFRFKLFVDALRQARSGPTPVRNIRKIAIGTFTRLKNGGPTVVVTPLIHSEEAGNIKPQHTATQ